MHTTAHTPIEYLERSARLFPNKTAVIDEFGTCTYNELLERSRAIAQGLLAADAQSNASGNPETCAAGSVNAPAPQPVVVFMEKRIDMLASFLGALMAGRFYVPVDPSVPAERARNVYATLANGMPGENGPVVIANTDTITAARAIFPEGRVALVDDLLQHTVDSAALENVARSLVSSNPAYVLFTSGSTGMPKGVAVSHRSICGFVDAFVEAFDIRDDDVIGNQAPFDFDVSVKDIYGALATGATIVLLPRRLFSAPAQLVDALREHKVTVMTWAVAALCLVSSLHGLDHAPLPSVRLVLFSGEVMPRKHLARWLEHLPEVTFANLYGPTEITCNCLYHIVDRSRAYLDGLPLGEPLGDRRILVLDEGMQPVSEPGQVGELYVGGPNIALGYYADPARTEGAFMPNPIPGALPETAYRTGDLVRIGEGGELFFSGRADNQIKHQGHRIELEEIDAAFERCPGVERCRCAYNERFKRIHAFFEGSAEIDELRRAVSSMLPGPMVPASIERVERMPLTKNGKVDRRALLNA